MAPQPGFGVEIDAAEPDGEVDGVEPVVGPGCPDAGARLDPDTGRDGDGLEVRVRGLETATVIDGDREPLGDGTSEAHHADTGRAHRGARRDTEVDAPMPGVLADGCE